MKMKLRIAGIIFFSLLAGFCNGFIGAGGGIILVFGLGLLCPDIFDDKRDIYANSQAVMLPVSVLSSIIYFIRGIGLPASPSAYVFPAIFGGVTGGLLLSHLKIEAVKIIFAIIVIISGLRMMIA